MSNIELPEATLIDIKRISKSCQGIVSAKLNYSKLFDLSNDYKFPSVYCNFSCEETSACYLTSTINTKEDGSKSFACSKLTSYWGGFWSGEVIWDHTSLNESTSLLNIRPVFKYSEIKEDAEVVEELAPGYLLITFGKYPMYMPLKINNIWRSISASAEIVFPVNTGNKFTYTTINNGKPTYIECPEVTFSELKETYVKKGNIFYIVRPVYFLVDVKKDFAISREVLFVLPTLKNAEGINSYKETFPYEFLNEYFVPELMQHVNRVREEIESQEIPEIKNLIDKIILTSENSVLQKIIRTELQALINEYNTCLDREKESDNSISLNLVSSDTLFIQKLEFLLSKITNYPYYKESKIVYECLNINIEDDKEVDSELYRDLVKIYKYILPTLPEEIRLLYQTKIKEILVYVQNLIIKTYQTSIKKDFNIELLIREMLQPVLENLYADVTKNYVLINLNDIINGIFASSKDKYLAHLFNLLNEEVKAIESLISATRKYEYKEELKQIISLYNEKNNTITNITNIYLDLLKLKQKLAQLDCKRNSLERKKIKRTII